MTFVYIMCDFHAEDVDVDAPLLVDAGALCLVVHEEDQIGSLLAEASDNTVVEFYAPMMLTEPAGN